MVEWLRGGALARLLEGLGRAAEVLGAARPRGLPAGGCEWRGALRELERLRALVAPGPRGP